MFKKKSAPKNYQNEGEIQSKVSESRHGIEAKLDSIINNNSKVLISRQQQPISNSRLEPSSFFNKYSNKNSLDNSNISQKKQSVGNSFKNIPQQSKISTQKKSPSFENQLKGLIKIIYQKEKEIQKLKQSIKEVSNKVQNVECKRCLRNQISPSMQELQSQQMSLNLNDIKQTTGKIMQLQVKQSQLHQVIDFLMKKQEDSNKKIKQLSLIVKQLSLQNQQLIAENQQISLANKQIQQHINQQQQDRKNNIDDEKQKLNSNIKQRDEQILKLNSDILKIVQSARSNQNQMSQKINLLIKENHYINHQFKQQQNSLKAQIISCKTEYQNILEDTKRKNLQLEKINDEQKNEIQKKDSKQQQHINQLQKKRQQLEQFRTKIQQQLKNFQQKSINKQIRIDRQQQIIKQLQSEKTKVCIEMQAIKSQIALLQARLSQSQSVTSVQKNVQYDQLLQQIRLNSTNKTTIEEYKKLLDKIQHENHLQQIRHQKEIKDYQQTIKQLQSKIIYLQDILETQTNQLSKQNATLKLNLQQITNDHSNRQAKTQTQLNNILKKHQLQKDQLKSNSNEELRIINQELNLTKKQWEITKNQLQSSKNQISSLLQQIQILKEQFRRKQNQFISLSTQFQQSRLDYQQAQTKLQETTLKLKQTNHQLIETIDLNNKLKTEIQSISSQKLQYSKHYQNQSLQIDIQCLKCIEMQKKLKQYQFKLQNIEKTQPDQIISFPTIGNLSNIDIANSSFQCKLEDLVQFSSRHFLSHESQGTPKTQKDIQNKKKTTTLLPLQQNSLQQDSSYVRYQDQVIKEIQKQCNQPTQVFFGRPHDGSKMVELSEIKQSLKMTKQVNFQLFQEINRQQKIIIEFKNVIRTFVQLQKQPQNLKGRNYSENQQIMISKLQNLLLIK